MPSEPMESESIFAILNRDAAAKSGGTPSPLQPWVVIDNTRYGVSKHGAHATVVNCTTDEEVKLAALRELSRPEGRLTIAQFDTLRSHYVSPEKDQPLPVSLPHNL